MDRQAQVNGSLTGNRIELSPHSTVTGKIALLDEQASLTLSPQSTIGNKIYFEKPGGRLEFKLSSLKSEAQKLITAKTFYQQLKQILRGHPVEVCAHISKTEVRPLRKEEIEIIGHRKQCHTATKHRRFSQAQLSVNHRYPTAIELGRKNIKP